jgi:pimeloyl-ACP methyl ester carboxylesterase
MLKDMIRKSEPYFIRWAMNAVLTWQNKEVPQPLFQIHGSKDAILPKRCTTPTHVINTGGHLMIMNRAEQINAILNEILIEC